MAEGDYDDGIEHRRNAVLRFVNHCHDWRQHGQVFVILLNEHQNDNYYDVGIMMIGVTLSGIYAT